MLEQLFGSRTRVKLLRLFLTHPADQFFVREITRAIDERLNSVRRELANLERLDIIRTVATDRKRHYRVNMHSVLYPELRALILKARLSVEQDALQRLKKAGSISLLVLTGVFTNVEGVQTDILVVGRVNRRKLRPLIRHLQQHFDTDIRFTVMSRKEYLYRRDITDKFLYTVLDNKKVVLIDTLTKAGKRDEEKA